MHVPQSMTLPQPSFAVPQFEDNTIDGFYTNIAISCATGTTFSGNVMNDAGMWGPFDKDGGYCGGEIIGTNTINGVMMTGYTL